MNGFVNIHAIKDSMTGNLAVALIMACEQGLFSFRWENRMPYRNASDPRIRI